jgi:ABC-type dipeptide/oligopeptide/nickel transport system ATPase component
MNADNILVVQEGRIVEEGKHVDLIKKVTHHHHSSALADCTPFEATCAKVDLHR